MAQAKAICKCERCGQSFTKMATKYNRQQADEWKAWAEEHCTVCTECWKAEKRAEEKAQNEKATEMFVLPELTGSEKQIKWAADIRVKMLADLAAHKLSAKGIENVNARLAVKTSAKWWIDHRQDSTTTFAKALVA